MQIDIAGHALRLLPSGACLHETTGTLLVADAHVGKDVSFRALGMPVPAAAGAATLAALSADIAVTRAQALVFLGDFLHAARSKTAPLIASLVDWRRAHVDVAMHLVRGNHDLRAGDPPAEVGITVVDEPWALNGPGQQMPFALCHHPQVVGGHYALCGHWHPAVRVSARAHQSLRLPCFWMGDVTAHPVGILPAYGAFTGSHPITRRQGDRVYVLAGDSVQNVSLSLSPSSAGADSASALA